MDKKVRIGVIGCGGIANGKHMPAEKRNPAAEMVAFCDIIEERAIKAREDFGKPEEYQPLLAESWEISPDHRTYRIKLRRGVLWHDFTDPVTLKTILRSNPGVVELKRGVVVSKRSCFELENED